MERDKSGESERNREERVRGREQRVGEREIGRKD